MKKRLMYFTLSILCFLSCIIIVKLFDDNLFIRGFTGDIIVILLIYFLVKAIYDVKPSHLAILVLGLGFITEFLQYAKLIRLLGLEQNTIAKLIIGSVFDPFDLIAYTLGAITVYIIDTKLIRH
ncbi:DUF2809 domain-containing protein [Pseudobacteroides cellulosolvens]|uniref:DUF2809 domain-containing protein n=1 Tax=Pseudobacteroides cellulosolvens ATCC 35603 = DSM 2933 TaxID=398512 RepID=A0A0L6JWC4_9FIRM|nr:DUF2809 domain-containing protein [Pseudobacteroides cellulosolvens]KNY30034.1 Protein of unknown function DUF2809 [Pseudobacteroides cellulosolvens ATCC 35603 = DSM 2933]